MMYVHNISGPKSTEKESKGAGWVKLVGGLKPFQRSTGKWSFLKGLWLYKVGMTWQQP